MCTHPPPTHTHTHTSLPRLPADTAQYFEDKLVDEMRAYRLALLIHKEQTASLLSSRSRAL